MPAVSRLVLRHKWAVTGFWLVVLVAGVAASAKLSSRLSGQFPLPGVPSYQANQQILRLYGNGGSGYPEVVVVRLPPGQAAASLTGRRSLGRAFAAVAAIHGLRIAAYPDTGDRGFLGSDGRTSYGLVFTPYAGELEPPSLAPQITAAIAPALPAGSTIQVTGMNELTSGGQARQGFGVLAETLLAGAAALAVLAFVFGSALALMPLLMAAVAIPACFLAIFGLAEITSVSVIVQYLVALIGLGVAIDYSLLLVTRWREELAAGHASEDAVGRAMATAGRSIVFSGGTVAVGLLSLIMLPVPALRSIGIGGMLVPAVSVALTVTLLPVLLATAGERMDWPRRRRTAAASRGWSAWTRLVVRHKWAATVAALTILGILRHHHPGSAGTAHPGPGRRAGRGARPDRGPHPRQRGGGAPRAPARGAARSARRRHPRRAGLAPRRHRPDQCPACRRTVHRRRRRHTGTRAARRWHRARHPDRRLWSAAAG